MEQIMQFITENLEISILVSVFVLMEGLKPFMVGNREPLRTYIPLVSGFLGILLYVWNKDWVFNFQNAMVGLISGWSATGGFETIKNTILKTKEEEPVVASVEEDPIAIDMSSPLMPQGLYEAAPVSIEVEEDAINYEEIAAQVELEYEDGREDGVDNV